MTVEWLEHFDLPDGQAVDLLKRYPYERASQIELAREHDMALTQSLLAEGGSTAVVLRQTRTGFATAVLKASLWSSSPTDCERPHHLKHSLTGANIDVSQIGMADDVTVKTLRDRALEHYVAWMDAAYPGPKGSGETDSQTPSTETPEPSGQTTPEATLSEIAA